MSTPKHLSWLTDEKLYPVGRFIDGKLGLKYYLRKNFPPFVVKSKFNKWFLHYTRWRCFVSDVQCYFLKHPNSISVYDIPWCLSVDHLAPMKFHRSFGAEYNPANGLVNQTIVGYILNTKLGHTPLALKLLHRQILRGIIYDRENPTRDTYETIRLSIVDTQKQFNYLGKYPWQPWAYDECDRAVPDAFMADMTAFDNEFFTMVTPESRKEFIDSFVWRW